MTADELIPIPVRWVEKREYDGVFVNVDGDKVTLGADETIKPRAKPLAEPDGLLPATGPLLLSGLFQVGPVDAEPYVEWATEDNRKDHLRLRTYAGNIILETKADRESFQKLAVMPMDDKTSFAFSLYLNGDRVGCHIDGELLFEGQHRLNIGVPEKSICAVKILQVQVCATFQDLKVSGKESM